MYFQNYINVEGRLTRDPELMTSKKGVKYCRFGICFNQNKKIKDEDGEQWESIPHFFNCVAFKVNAENVARMRKGEPVSVVGKLQYSQYEKDGERISNVSIQADSVKKLLIEKKAKAKKENTEQLNEQQEEKTLEEYSDDIPF